MVELYAGEHFGQHPQSRAFLKAKHPPSWVLLYTYAFKGDELYTRWEGRKNLTANSKRSTKDCQHWLDIRYTNDIWDSMAFQYHLCKFIHIVIQCLPIMHQLEHTNLVGVFKRICAYLNKFHTQQTMSYTVCGSPERLVQSYPCIFILHVKGHRLRTV
jgi:hypothetical protein